MSDKNKKFRNHCDIDVLLDKDENSVSVKVSYKPEMFQHPMDRQRHRYSLLDVKEELSRQGISIDVDSRVSLIPHGGVIDNTSRHQKKHSLTATFKFISKRGEENIATPPNPSPSSTKKTSTKKVTKTTSKTTNK